MPAASVSAPASLRRPAGGPAPPGVCNPLRPHAAVVSIPTPPSPPPPWCRVGAPQPAAWTPLLCVQPPRMGDPHVPQFLLQVNFSCVRRLWKWNRPSCLELGLLASVWLLSGREDAQGTAQLYLFLPFYGEIGVWGALPGAPPGAPWSFHLVFSTSRAERSSLSSCS